MYKEYRIHRKAFTAVAHVGSVSEGRSDWKPTRLTLKARNKDEAQRKARKIWQDGDYGAGSIVAIPINSSID